MKKAKTSEQSSVLVGLSGGVDSLVTAALLKQQRFRVLGLHLQTVDFKSKRQQFVGNCCRNIDNTQLREICKMLDIPLYVVNVREDFEDKVEDYFVHELIKNRMPVPCVYCNTFIKFKYLLEHADKLQCEYIATGHYCQIQFEPNTDYVRLLRALDKQKDQTFFLFQLSSKTLQRTLTPLGSLSQKMVLKLAEEFGLEYDLKESNSGQQSCFINDNRYKTYIESRSTIDLRPKGAVRSVGGTLLGDHNGLFQFQIGQKKGIPLTNKRSDFTVLEFRASDAALIVGDEKDLYAREVVVSNTNWLKTFNYLHGLKCTGKVRADDETTFCEVSCFENSGARVVFEKPIRAMSAGQAIVFYEKDEVIGGGFITEVIKEKSEDEANPSKNARLQSESAR